MVNEPASLACIDGTNLAYHHSAGDEPGVLFCTGFRSNMTGKKATSIENWCQSQGQQFTRFDYRGHGKSGGNFRDLTIGDWLEDTISILDSVTDGPQLLVGSSMGGWISFLTANARPEKVAGIIGIAPAVDMTKRALSNLSAEAKRELSETGAWMRPSKYDSQGYPITKKLLDEGELHLLLPGPINFQGPVRILHGMRDDAVPWELSLEIAAALTSDDVQIKLIKDGDHRLSRPKDTKLLLSLVSAFLATSKGF